MGQIYSIFANSQFTQIFFSMQITEIYGPNVYSISHLESQRISWLMSHYQTIIIICQLSYHMYFSWWNNWSPCGHFLDLVNSYSQSVFMKNFMFLFCFYFYIYLQSKKHAQSHIMENNNKNTPKINKKNQSNITEDRANMQT